MANRQTKVLGGSLAQSQSFTLDPGLFQYIQSVLVEVDNTAGPDVNPTLTVATVNGTPIADKTQGSVIPAGDTGRATWALRLTDETSLTVAAVTTAEYGSGFNTVASGTLADWFFVSGTALLDLTNTKKPLVLADGTYALVIIVGFGGPGAANAHSSGFLQVIRGGPQVFAVRDFRDYVTNTLGTNTLTVLSPTLPLLAGDELRLSASWTGVAGNRDVFVTFYVTKIG